MNSKTIWLSKTFWLQIALIIAALFPQAQAWLKANPVEVVSVVAALNVLMRFATSGRISLTGAGEDGKLLPGLLMMSAYGGAGLLGLAALPSCSASQMEALRAVPFRGAVVTDYGTVGYSSKTGVSLLVDRSSGK